MISFTALPILAKDYKNNVVRIGVQTIIVQKNGSVIDIKTYNHDFDNLLAKIKIKTPENYIKIVNGLATLNNNVINIDFTNFKPDIKWIKETLGGLYDI